MTTVAVEEELFRSCRILFGEKLKVSREFLQYLQLSGIKKAYRSKALEIHPDRVSCQDLIMRQNLTQQFNEVHEAYKILVKYLEARKTGEPHQWTQTFFTDGKVKKKAKKNQRPTGPANGATNYQAMQGSGRFNNGNGSRKKYPLHKSVFDPKSLYRGPIPNRRLLFGRYLYYSGMISLQTIGKALIWQQSQRPRFGEAGKRLGWLNDQDIVRILQNRGDRQLFGESALRLGILTREQLQLLLQHQKSLHKRIGQYFVEQNYLDPVMLAKHVTAHRMHNNSVQNILS